MASNYFHFPGLGLQACTNNTLGQGGCVILNLLDARAQGGAQQTMTHTPESNPRTLADKFSMVPVSSQRYVGPA